MIFDSLLHSGTPHQGSVPHSGRYEWGSGEDPYQRNKNFSAANSILKKQGISEIDRAAFFGYLKSDGTGDIEALRRNLGIASDMVKQEQNNRVAAMVKHGCSNVYIGEKLGCSEGTIRNIRKNLGQEKVNKTEAVADALKDQMTDDTYLDIGSGTELYLNITEGERDLNVSRNTLDKALQKLKDEGYEVYTVPMPQVTNWSQKTNIQLLCPPGTTYKDAVTGIDKIQPVTRFFPDGAQSYWKPEFPASMDSKRLYIDYANSAGENAMDGVIELRRNVKDLSLGNSLYSQVRIMVDDKFYLKGMALYSDDIPDGYDVVFHTNKKPGTPIMNSDPNGKSVLKPVETINGEVNRNLPFGAAIMRNGQSKYIDIDGQEKLSLINKINDEGKWDDWTRSVASQMLSKQPQKTINKQLELSLQLKKDEFMDICALNNPTIKRKLLMTFADDCDGNAVDLKAIAFPNQTTRVILPVKSMKDDEIYAPGYLDGTEVCLVRYPHQGTFEIPRLIVNNKQKEADKIITKLAKDAVGINAKVAAHLSGADFDGDTVVVIPTKSPNGTPITNISNKAYLDDLKDFNAKAEYPEIPGMKVMTSKQKGKKMGEITNLITDMTFQGASESEIVRATKHAMVVIDAEKHRLNYELSYEMNGIQQLKQKYQRYTDPNGVEKYGGAGSLISRSKSPVYVDARKQWSARESTERADGSRKSGIDILTGQKVYEYENSYIKDKKKYYDWLDSNPSLKQLIFDAPDKSGYDGKASTRYRVQELYKKEHPENVDVNKQKSSKMAEANTIEEINSLISSANTSQEKAYAKYAYGLKSLANEARKEYLNTGKLEYHPSAYKTYKQEVDQLNADLQIALKNSPRERQAQVLANTKMALIFENNPALKDDDAARKKEAQQALNEARAQVGATKIKVPVSEKQWEAIQAGAIHDSKLSEILENTDIDKIKEYATPRKSNTKVSSQKLSTIRALADKGNYTLAEIANMTGVSVSTVSEAIKG